MSILGVVLTAGSLNLERIIQQQASAGLPGWNVWTQPLAMLLFLVSIFAECNRLPFDLPEAEQELIGGYHTEYSALKFGLFFLGEYTHMITTSLLLICLFGGGWHFPLIAEPGPSGLLGILAKLAVIGFKLFAVICFYMLVRWTIPRFRFDQLMGMAWKVLLPLSLANLVGVTIVLELGWSRWVLLPYSILLLLAAGALTLGRSPKPRTRRVVSGPSPARAVAS
jgi:NADH-quinone oxidoreductase subunit H